MTKLALVILIGVCVACASSASLSSTSVQDYQKQLEQANSILNGIFVDISRSNSEGDESSAVVKRSSYGGGSSDYGGGGSGILGSGLMSGFGGGIGSLLGSILRSLSGIGIKLGLNLNQEFYEVQSKGGYGGGNGYSSGY